MTIYHDRSDVDLSDDLGRPDDVGRPEVADPAERRVLTSGVRVSWASSQPFVVGDPGATPGDSTSDPLLQARLRRNAWARPLRSRALAGDGVVAGAVGAAAFASHGAEWAPTLLCGSLCAAAWCAVLWSLRAYDSRRIGEGPEEFGMVARAAVAVLVLIALGSYSLQLLVPRRYVFVAVPVVAAVTVIHRHLLRGWLRSRRRLGFAVRRTLVVGSPSAVDDVVRDLAGAPSHGYDLIGACVPLELADVGIAAGVPVVGTLSDIPQSVVDHEADIVIVAGSGLSSASLRRLSWALERTGTDLVVAPGLVEVAGPRLRVRPTAGLSLLHVELPEHHSGRLLIKALLDRTLGLALLVASSPLIAVAAVLVHATSRGGAFFRQERVGREGATFTLVKLRSMVVDAEGLRTAELLGRNEHDGVLFKIRRDPRVTRVGAFLRRYSIDELPQLWNVVRGDMSLVGPRPPLRTEFDRYHDAVHRRMRVKPGITGLWQVSGRSDLTWEESVRLDLRYVDNWSMAFDLQILWKTARAVLSGSGAY